MFVTKTKKKKKKKKKKEKNSIRKNQLTVDAGVTFFSSPFFSLFTLKGVHIPYLQWYNFFELTFKKFQLTFDCWLIQIFVCSGQLFCTFINQSINLVIWIWSGYLKTPAHILNKQKQFFPTGKTTKQQKNRENKKLINPNN